MALSAATRIATGTGSSVLPRFPCSKPCAGRSVRVSNKRDGRFKRLVAVRAAKETGVELKETGVELKETGVELKESGVRGDILPSGEWAQSFSLLNYEDLTKHYEPVLFKPEAQPSTILAEVMSKVLYIAFPDQAFEEVDRHFTEISGLPVVDDGHKCVGVLSRKDRSKASDLKTKVKDIMSSPAITLSAGKTVSDAAVLMLKNKIHRIPVVNDQMQVVGMVTRTDIFTALEGGA